MIVSLRVPGLPQVDPDLHLTDARRSGLLSSHFPRPLSFGQGLRPSPVDNAINAY